MIEIATPSSPPQRCAACRASGKLCSDCVDRAIAWHPQKEMRARVARKARRQYFPFPCPTHGPDARHSAKTATCCECAPEERAYPGQSLRAQARARGAKMYTARCITHGPGPHYVSHGKCACCYTAAGAPRVRERVSAAPRAEARRAGSPVYLGECETHGETAHSVAHGKCLSCFNTQGLRRPANLTASRWRELCEYLQALNFTSDEIATIVAGRDRRS